MKRILIYEFQPDVVLIQIVIVSLTVEIDALGEKKIFFPIVHTAQGVLFYVKFMSMETLVNDYCSSEWKTDLMILKKLLKLLRCQSLLPNNKCQDERK